MQVSTAVDPNQHLERTSFQNFDPYDPRIDLKSDVAIVYGIDPGLPNRIKVWRDQGYITHVMTGCAWGNYQDYLSGKWDGVNHQDNAQTRKDGKPILHGKDVPYMCPTQNYGKYLCVGVKRAIDAGAQAIYMEEPEFWVDAGYSEAFKREWQAYYNEPWIAPHTSPDAQYRASKLKYYLYRRALEDVFTFVREYGQQIGRDVKCYVPTHSLVNYASWRIVSPESSLVMIPGCDGYVGQVWTGTARTPNIYKGVAKERTFETGFLEYGSLHNLVRATGRRMWYLNDPIEDSPNFCWADYKMNWESTLVASLLWPDVWRYEVMPWPTRVFTFKYPKKNVRDMAPGEKVDKEGIPADYATELLTVINELNNMNQKEISWDCNARGIGVLVSDTMMFQRDSGSLDLASFFGLAMPIVKSGVPVEPVQLENTTIPGYLKDYKVLFMTYQGMKPMKPEYHDAIADWVKSGGVLVVVDDDKDPYNTVKEWWNTSPMAYAAPRLHLFEKLGISGEGTHKVGSGAVVFFINSPADIASRASGAQEILCLARQACQLAGLDWNETNYLLLNRGPYVIGAGLDETEKESAVRVVKGLFVDLFSPTLEVKESVSLSPGSRVFLLDINKVDRSAGHVLASASKVLAATCSANSLEFHSEGPKATTCATRLLLPSAPKQVLVDGKTIDAAWDENSRTALIKYANSPDGHRVTVNW
ncbi:MAG: hypothetical protein ABFD49_01960 [Armatimonadota bacterium]|nr:hypothetical protein [bacterium]